MHTVTASYGGDTNFGASSDSASATPLMQTVNQARTVSRLNASVNPSVVTQTVSFTATVTAQGPGTGTPTGNVTFAVDGVQGAPVPIAGGIATFSTASLTVGNHTITAAYSGDSNFLGGSAMQYVQTVTSSAGAAALADFGVNHSAVAADGAVVGKKGSLAVVGATIPNLAFPGAMRFSLPVAGVDAYFASGHKSAASAAGLQGGRKLPREDEWLADPL
jgi:hypothetical protein